MELEKIIIKDIEIVEYSSKSIAIFGNTKPIKEILKSCNCHYNQNLIGGCGWVASKKRRNLIVTKLNNYFKTIEK